MNPFSGNDPEMNAAIEEAQRFRFSCAFMLICITVIYLRFTRPDLNRPFKMPTS